MNVPSTLARDLLDVTDELDRLHHLISALRFIAWGDLDPQDADEITATVAERSAAVRANLEAVRTAVRGDGA